MARKYYYLHCSYHETSFSNNNNNIIITISPYRITNLITYLHSHAHNLFTRAGRRHLLRSVTQAVDKIPHNFLLNKLETFGLPSGMLRGSTITYLLDPLLSAHYKSFLPQFICFLECLNFPSWAPFVKDIY